MEEGKASSMKVRLGLGSRTKSAHIFLRNLRYGLGPINQHIQFKVSKLFSSLPIFPFQVFRKKTGGTDQNRFHLSNYKQVLLCLLSRSELLVLNSNFHS